MSRLTSITLENFKGYAKSQKIPIRPLTLIFGPNSAGKSSIFHALAFLKWCQSKNNCDPDKVELGWESVSLGGISNLVHGHDLSRTMKIGLGFLRTNQWGDEEINTEWQFENLQSLDSNSEAYTASSCNITVNGKPEAAFKNIVTAGIDWRGRMKYSQSEVESLSNVNPNEEKHVLSPFSRLFDRAWDEFVRGRLFLPTPESHSEESLSKLREQFIREFISHIDEYGIRFEGLYPGFQDMIDRNSRDQNHYYDWENALRNMRNGLASGELSPDDRWEFFDQFLRKSIRQGKDGSYLMIPETMGADMFWIFQDHIHVGPLRQPPFRDLDETTLLERKEWEPWARLIRNENLRKEVSDALTALGVEYEIIKGVQETRTSFPDSNAKESKSIKAVLRFRKNGKEEAGPKVPLQVASSHLDLGFGVSTILPLVVALHSDCSLLTIEQPELHIHPKLQTDLGDLLIKKALGLRQDGKETTVLVETHCEHLILRILRRIRETTRGVLPGGFVGISPKDVAVLFVEPGSDGSNVREIRISPQGRFIDDWPDGFFEERFNEVF